MAMMLKCQQIFLQHWSVANLTAPARRIVEILSHLEKILTKALKLA